MKNTSGKGPAMASTKGDSVTSKAHGTEANGILNGGASSIANGSLNYNSNMSAKGNAK